MGQVSSKHPSDMAAATGLLADCGNQRRHRQPDYEQAITSFFGIYLFQPLYYAGSKGKELARFIRVDPGRRGAMHSHVP